jgi:hypothetical protein
MHQGVRIAALAAILTASAALMPVASAAAAPSAECPTGHEQPPNRWRTNFCGWQVSVVNKTAYALLWVHGNNVAQYDDFIPPDGIGKVTGLPDSSPAGGPQALKFEYVLFRYGPPTRAQVTTTPGVQSPALSTFECKVPGVNMTCTFTRSSYYKPLEITITTPDSA